MGNLCHRYPLRLCTLDSVWPYIATIVAAMLFVFGVGRRVSKRKRGGTQSIDVGKLSDEWLAEHRSSRTDE
jgi:hypothetical protein